MNPHQREELDLTARFLSIVGYPQVALEPGDRPDVIANIDGHRIGIEETKFHANEQPGTGSPLRAEEAQKARQVKERPYSMWVPLDSFSGIVARVEDKIQRATKYDASRYAELWLLISAQLPVLPGMASTFIVGNFVDVARLNEATHGLLTNSPFAAAHIHLVTSHALFSWSREKQWYANRVSDE